MLTTSIARSRGIARVLVAVAVAAATASVARSQPPGSPPASLEPPGGALVAAGPAPSITLLYTGDVIGFLDPCG